MKTILFLVIFILSSMVLKSQDYQLTYQESIQRPPSPNNQEENSTSFIKIGFHKVLVKDDLAVSFFVKRDTVAKDSYLALPKNKVYYSSINEKKTFLIDKTILEEYYTSFDFSLASEWMIKKDYIPYGEQKAYLAIKKDGTKVYFVPEIPVAFGPRNLSGGLPGLIIRVESKSGILELVSFEKAESPVICMPNLNSLTHLTFEDFIKMRTMEILKQRRTKRVD